MRGGDVEGVELAGAQGREVLGGGDEPVQLVVKPVEQRDLRPGSLDSWDRPLSAQPRIAPEDPAAAPPPQADAAETTTSPTEKDDR